MHRSTRFTALITIPLLMLLASACDKSKSDKSSEPAGAAATPAGKGTSGAPAKGGGGSGPFAGWDLEARKAAFQGAHLTPSDGMGHWQAWDVKGDKVTIWDGTAEKSLELTVDNPCEVRVTEKSADGSSSSTMLAYTVRNGSLVMGMGGAGARNGATAIACLSDVVVTLDATGACTEWKQDMFDRKKWASSPGTCSLAKVGDKEIFKATVEGRERELQVDGDALLSEQLAGTHSEKLADFAAAKAARDAKK